MHVPAVKRVYKALSCDKLEFHLCQSCSTLCTLATVVHAILLGHMATGLVLGFCISHKNYEVFLLSEYGNCDRLANMVLILYVLLDKCHCGEYIL